MHAAPALLTVPGPSTLCLTRARGARQNVEGIHWVSQGADGSAAPGTLVAVSDKMKSKGRQPAACHDKDQSVHLFALP